MERTLLANGEIYHVFNRGIDRRLVFTSKKEKERALMSLDYYRFENPPLGLGQALLLDKEKRKDYFSDLRSKNKRVEMVCYCLMPNHFHLLLRQETEGGISGFLSDFANSYTRYFNIKHERKGPLFQGVFKFVRIETAEQLIHVSRYIHLNPFKSFFVKKKEISTYPWSSVFEYWGILKNGICDIGPVLEHFSGVESYKKFIFDQIEEMVESKLIDHLILE